MVMQYSLIVNQIYVEQSECCPAIMYWQYRFPLSKVIRTQNLVPSYGRLLLLIPISKSLLCSFSLIKSKNVWKLCQKFIFCTVNDSNLNCLLFFNTFTADWRRPVQRRLLFSLASVVMFPSGYSPCSHVRYWIVLFPPPPRQHLLR